MLKSSIIQKLTTGLTSYQIKMIAIFFMTLDHLGAYGYKIPFIAEHYNILRILGRIAAPLFLYLIIESAKQTKNKKKFVLRLYIAGVAVGLFTAVMNLFLGQFVGVFSSSNILFTFFYTVIYVYLFEGLIFAFRQKQKKQLFCYAVGIMATIIPIFLYRWAYSSYVTIFQKPADRYSQLISDIFGSFIVSPLHIGYSFMFVIIGIAFYFTKRKNLHGIIFAAFCCLSYLGWMVQSSINLRLISEFISYLQCWMILALPFIWLYNGKRGKEQKLFFYIYYPLHRYVIFVLAALIH